MKKLKTSLIALTKISLICLAFFMFSPSLKAHAMFSDTASINMGIKLELGTVSLATKDTTISKDVRFTDGKPVLISESILINNGSLTGKIAYKIDVKKEDETDLKAEELQDMSVIIDFGGVANKVTASGASLNTKKFTFAKDSSSNDVIVEPDSLGILATVNYKNSDPTKDKKLKITVTFRLIQSNAADANAEMFSDEESLTNTVTLVPKVVEEKSYWPATSTFVNVEGKFSYSLEKMNMFYSETYDSLGSEKRKIMNLNKAILYIKIPGKDPLEETYRFSQLTTGNPAIVEESREFNEEHHGMIITYNLNDSYVYNSANLNPHANAYALSMNIKIEKDGMYSPGQYGELGHSYISIPFFATQLVLSSDILSETNDWNFEHKAIYLPTSEDSITIKQLKGTSHSVKKSDFEDVQLPDETDVELELTGKQAKHVGESLISKNELSLKLKSNGNLDGAFLNIKITGDTGNTLVIHRKLENKFKSTTAKSTPFFLAEEPNEQVTDSEKSVEETDSTMDSSVVDESAVETLIEESDEENLIDEIEVTEEVVDSSSADSAVESSDQAIPVK